MVSVLVSFTYVQPCLARVSPLKHANLNCLGHYSFAARPPREGLRPLRDPATVHLDEDDEGTGE
ncbi:hypothetical protein OG762_23265 [Streptomyces sp. NBC_01136]|uniref:hypothetical protein n=1 Tax=unclassified Streptomyces TaxID=2593676 RepID=UPI00324D2755|nr:hypothetical protein OG762_23265 [Streptomyces sp. NBC_01136]